MLFFSVLGTPSCENPYETSFCAHFPKRRCVTLAHLSLCMPCPFMPYMSRGSLTVKQVMISEASILAGTFGNGTDSAQVLAFDANSGSTTPLASLPNPRFGLALVQLPSERLLAVGGGAHVNDSQVRSILSPSLPPFPCPSPLHPISLRSISSHPLAPHTAAVLCCWFKFWSALKLSFACMHAFCT